jgi:hypothetical protein
MASQACHVCGDYRCVTRNASRKRPRAEDAAQAVSLDAPVACSSQAAHCDTVAEATNADASATMQVVKLINGLGPVAPRLPCRIGLMSPSTDVTPDTLTVSLADVAESATLLLSSSKTLPAKSDADMAVWRSDWVFPPPARTLTRTLAPVASMASARRVDAGGLPISHVQPVLLISPTQIASTLTWSAGTPASLTSEVSRASLTLAMKAPTIVELAAPEATIPPMRISAWTAAEVGTRGAAAVLHRSPLQQVNVTSPSGTVRPKKN